MARAVAAATRGVVEATSARPEAFQLTLRTAPALVRWTTKSPPITRSPANVRSYRTWVLPSRSVMTSLTFSCSRLSSRRARAVSAALACAAAIADRAEGPDVAVVRAEAMGAVAAPATTTALMAPRAKPDFRGFTDNSSLEGRRGWATGGSRF